jgi:hypothetical protein
MGKIQFGLEFPEASFLMIGDRPYLWMEGEDTAYAMPYGETKELEGKHVYIASQRHNGGRVMKLAHELEDGTLIAARLTTEFGKSAGILMEADKLTKANEMLEQGALELYNKPSPSRICYAGQLMDQRYVVWVDDYSNGSLDRSLFMGAQKDKLEKVEYETYMQGGNSFNIRIADGEFLSIDPSARRGGAMFEYGDIKGVGIDVEDDKDLAAWGIELGGVKPHYDIYSHPKSKLAM